MIEMKKIQCPLCLEHGINAQGDNLANICTCCKGIVCDNPPKFELQAGGNRYAMSGALAGGIILLAIIYFLGFDGFSKLGFWPILLIPACALAGGRYGRQKVKKEYEGGRFKVFPPRNS